jgi:hypothetical protein
MHHDYQDIRSRIAEEPKWFDEHAVPRFNNFEPSEIANIYAEECALVLIKCQNCDHEFKVAFSFGTLDKMDHGETVLRNMLSELAWPQTKDAYVVMRKEAYARAWGLTLAERIRLKNIGYGDPPNIWCCAAGPTMTSDTVRVLEYWRRYESDTEGNVKSIDWTRYPELEIDLSE